MFHFAGVPFCPGFPDNVPMVTFYVPLKIRLNRRLANDLIRFNSVRHKTMQNNANIRIHWPILSAFNAVDWNPGQLLISVIPHQ
jgi:hypothetical protein